MFGTTTQDLITKIRTSRSPLKKRAIIIIGILALLAVGAAVYFFTSANKPQDWKKNTAQVEHGSVDVRIIATGTIRPVNEIKVSPKSTGLIKQLYVKQGDLVKTGQILAQMDDSNIRGQLEAVRGTYLMAKDNYLKVSNGNRPQEVAIARFQERRARDIVSSAQQNVIRLKAQIESLTQQTIRDDTLADRQTYLESQGAVSDQDKLNAETQSKMTHANLDAARRELAQAEATLAQNHAELSAAQEQHELSRIGNRQEDIMSAEHAVVQAKGNYDTLQSQLNDMTIRAPFDGVITQKYADSGAIVTPTTSAATTSATSSSIVALAGTLEMVAQVAETDIGKIQLGQPVEIISNAYPDMVFHGHVTQIAPEAVVTQNVTTFEAHTSIDDDGTPVVHHHRHHGGEGHSDAGQSGTSAESAGGSDQSSAQTAASTESGWHHHRHGQGQSGGNSDTGSDRSSNSDRGDQNPAQTAASTESGWHHRRHGQGQSDGSDPSTYSDNANDHPKIASSETGGHHHRHGQMANTGNSPKGEEGDNAASSKDRTSSSDTPDASSSKHAKTDATPTAKLLSGMNVSAKFVAGKLDDVMLIPTVCVMSKHGKTGVLVAQADGTPKFKPVITGPTVGTKTAVMRGLQDSDLVFMGLSKDQLEKNGYNEGGSEMRARARESNRGAPIPRTLGR